MLIYIFNTNSTKLDCVKVNSSVIPYGFSVPYGSLCKYGIPIAVLSNTQLYRAFKINDYYVVVLEDSDLDIAINLISDYLSTNLNRVKSFVTKYQTLIEALERM